jgi:hypothetical protein
MGFLRHGRAKQRVPLDVCGRRRKPGVFRGETALELCPKSFSFVSFVIFVVRHSSRPEALPVSIGRRRTGRKIDCRKMTRRRQLRDFSAINCSASNRRTLRPRQVLHHIVPPAAKWAKSAAGLNETSALGPARRRFAEKSAYTEAGQVGQLTKQAPSRRLRATRCKKISGHNDASQRRNIAYTKGPSPAPCGWRLSLAKPQRARSGAA